MTADAWQAAAVAVAAAAVVLVVVVLRARRSRMIAINDPSIFPPRFEFFGDPRADLLGSGRTDAAMAAAIARAPAPFETYQPMTFHAERNYIALKRQMAAFAPFDERAARLSEQVADVQRTSENAGKFGAAAMLVATAPAPAVPRQTPVTPAR